MYTKLPQIEPKKLLCRLFPICKWSRSYDPGTAIGDLIAGITVALTLIPQSIAYASLAGLEPQYGLYASLAGGFVYAVMGTIPQINIGPTALLSLLTFTYINGTSPQFAVLLCFTSGVVQLFAGIAQLGFLVDFVSLPVVSGFTSAAAVTIASSQIKGLLGLRFNAESFTATWEEMFKHIGDTRMADTILSVVCCLVLMGMKVLKDVRFKEVEVPTKKRNKKYFEKAFWFAGVSRNAVVVVLAAMVAYCMYHDKDDPFILTGNITPGLPKPQLPPFSATVGNVTYSAGEMLAHLGSGLAVVPLVGIIANVAIAKAFSSGKTLDATQEIIALGVCNIISSFFSSFPVNGSFTRSAVSNASGVRTTGAGFYTGIIVILTLVLLTPFFFFIPRAALSSVIICAVLHMVDYEIIKKLWDTSRLDLIPLFGTFLFCLGFGIEIGLICGVVIDAILLLYYNSRPPLDIQYVNDGSLPPHYAIHPVGRLHFAATERVRTKISSLRNKNNSALKSVGIGYPLSVTVIPDGNEMIHAVEINGKNNTSHPINVSNGLTAPKTTTPAKILVVYCDGLHRMDYTFLQGLQMLIKDWSAIGRVVWCGTRPEVRAQLSAAMPGLDYCDDRPDLVRLLTGAGADDTQGAVDTQL